MKCTQSFSNCLSHCESVRWLAFRYAVHLIFLLVVLPPSEQPDNIKVIKHFLRTNNIMESCPIGHPRLILLKLLTPAFVIDFFYYYYSYYFMTSKQLLCSRQLWSLTAPRSSIQSWAQVCCLCGVCMHVVGFLLVLTTFQNMQVGEMSPISESMCTHAWCSEKHPFHSLLPPHSHSSQDRWPWPG